MDRAMALFHRQGLEPVAAPVALPAQQAGQWSPEDFFPSSYPLHRTEIAIHEYLGPGLGQVAGGSFRTDGL